MTDLGKTILKNPVLMDFAIVFHTSKTTKNSTILQKEPGTLQYSSLKGFPNENLINIWDKGGKKCLGRDDKLEASCLSCFNFSKALVSYW